MTGTHFVDEDDVKWGEWYNAARQILLKYYTRKPFPFEFYVKGGHYKRQTKQEQKNKVPRKQLIPPTKDFFQENKLLWNIDRNNQIVSSFVKVQRIPFEAGK